METLFGIAEKIATPLSLAALVLLVLYAIYKLIFERLPLEGVVSKDVFRLASLGMTFLFILGIVSLILGMSSYLLISYINAARTDKADILLKDLGSDSQAVRLAATYGLVALAGISEAVDSGICSGIASLVRRSEEVESTPVLRPVEADTQAAVGALSTLIGGRYCKSTDLSRSNLRGVQLPQGKLMQAKLTSAVLDEANLESADLSEARLIGTSLVEATLRGATVKGATFNEARIFQTDLRGANLSGAKGLADTDLRTAKMSGAILDGVDLRRSKLPSMQGTSLNGADLRQTDLRFSKGICQKDIRAAITDSTTKVPDHFEC